MLPDQATRGDKMFGRIVGIILLLYAAGCFIAWRNPRSELTRYIYWPRTADADVIRRTGAAQGLLLALLGAVFLVTAITDNRLPAVILLILAVAALVWLWQARGQSAR
jgi:hypothetical protein